MQPLENPHLYFWLLAQSQPGPFRAVSQYLHRGGTGRDLTVLIAAISSLLALWLLLTWLERLRIARARWILTPKALFAELCQSQQLSRRERQLLGDAAASLPAEELCMVFVDPKYLRRFTRTHSRDGVAFQQLGKKLFGEACSAESV